MLQRNRDDRTDNEKYDELIYAVSEITDDQGGNHLLPLGLVIKRTGKVADQNGDGQCHQEHQEQAGASGKHGGIGRYGFRIRKFKSKREIMREGYIPKVLGVVNRAYANLYGYSEMDQAQMEAYAKQYLPFLDKRYLSVVETAEGEVIGMGICITSLSRAIQKAKAKLFPFGWYYMAKALWFNRHPETLDMLLVGVLPEYQEKGANALIFADLIPEGTKDGYLWAETHHQLEDNIPSQAQWKNLDCVIHKRRAAFGKDI